MSSVEDTIPGIVAAIDPGVQAAHPTVHALVFAALEAEAEIRVLRSKLDGSMGMVEERDSRIEVAAGLLDTAINEAVENDEPTGYLLWLCVLRSTLNGGW